MSIKSSLLSAINAVLAKVGAIPYNWNTNQLISYPFPTQLFQHVAIYNDQLKKEESGEGETYAKPACFIQVAQDNIENLVGGVTSSDIMFKLFIVDRQDDAGDGTMNQNLSIFAWRDLVKVALQNYVPSWTDGNGDTCVLSGLFLVDEQTDDNHDNVYCYTMSLKSCLIDNVSNYDLYGSIKEPDTNADITANITH